MFHSLRQALEVAYSTQDIWAGMPYLMVAAAIMIGGSIGIYIVFYTLDFLVSRAYGVIAYVRHPNKLYRDKPRRSCGNLYYLITLTLFFGCLALVIWVASASAGYNPWTSTIASLGIGIIGTYVFSAPLALISAGFALHSTNAIAVGEYWEIGGLGEGWDGIILEIGTLAAGMGRYDSKRDSAEYISMPLTHFLQQPCKRNYELEAQMHAYQPFVTADQWKEMRLAEARAAHQLQKKMNAQLRPGYGAASAPPTTNAANTTQFRARKAIHNV